MYYSDYNISDWKYKIILIINNPVEWQHPQYVFVLYGQWPLSTDYRDSYDNQAMIRLIINYVIHKSIGIRNTCQSYISSIKCMLTVGK